MTRPGQVAAAVALVAVVGLATAGRAETRAPRTVVDFPGIVRDLAHEGSFVTWIDSAWVVRVRDLRTRAQRSIFYTNPYQEFPDFDVPRRLLLERGTLLWLRTSQNNTFDVTHRVDTASAARPRRRALVSVTHLLGLDGGYVSGISGDETGFSYGIVSVRAVAPESGEYKVDGGGIWSFAGGRPRKLPDIRPPWCSHAPPLESRSAPSAPTRNQVARPSAAA